MVTNPNAPPATALRRSRSRPRFTDTLTTNQSDYSAGEPVQMTFTMTNTCAMSRPRSSGGSVNDGFIVTQGNQVDLAVELRGGPAVPRERYRAAG